jgi:hypothetical protein
MKTLLSPQAKFAWARAFALPLLGAAMFSSIAQGDTQGPGATLYKLDDRWVSVLPQQQVVVRTPVAPVPERLETVDLPGFRPDPNYSGACHVSVDLANKTYVLNQTSSTDQVLAQPEGTVCMPTERLAIDSGFSLRAR